MVGRKLGSYEVVEKLGEGGMGEVWRATDTKLDREVAIKVLPAALASDADRMARFQREARAASSLNHPNICTVYDIGQQDDRAFIVMEYLHGQTLKHRIGGRPMDIRMLLTLTLEICDGLDAAHAEGIVHQQRPIPRQRFRTHDAPPFCQTLRIRWSLRLTERGA